MQEDHYSKKELKELRKLKELESKTLEKKQNMIKTITISIASLLFLAFFIAIIVVAKQSKENAVTSLSASGWVRGNTGAKVNLVEFSDLQCPACKAYKPIVDQALKEFGGKLKLTYKHFPLSIHKNSTQVARAAEAAGEQGKFWEMHDLLFEKQEEWSVIAESEIFKKFISYAVELGLNETKFKLSFDSKALETKIKSQQNEGITAGVSSTPTFFINGKKIENPGSYKDFKKLIEREIKK